GQGVFQLERDLAAGHEPVELDRHVGRVLPGELADDESGLVGPERRNLGWEYLGDLNPELRGLDLHDRHVEGRDESGEKLGAAIDVGEVLLNPDDVAAGERRQAVQIVGVDFDAKWDG